jgi:hypothetical protein
MTYLQTILEHPLGGFIQTYKSVCEFYQVEPREDIVWDMENLFVSGNIRSFNLKGRFLLPKLTLRI